MAQVRALIAFSAVFFLVACKQKPTVFCLEETKLDYENAINADPSNLLRPILSGRGAILRDSHTNAFQKVSINPTVCNGKALNNIAFYDLMVARNLQKDSVPRYCAMSYVRSDLNDTPGNLNMYLSLSGLRQARSSGQDNLVTFFTSESCDLMQAAQNVIVTAQPIKVQGGEGEIGYLLNSEIVLTPTQP
jgi:hypothetical protein